MHLRSNGKLHTSSKSPWTYMITITDRERSPHRYRYHHGLAGNTPEKVDIDSIAGFIARVEETERLPVGVCTVILFRSLKMAE
ncbi:hypothetical protein O9993_08730 [Vibrio lentus]|nr:hypothetical protein [Vibrio lentus]